MSGKPGGATPKISVIIPVYNGASFISQTLDSILGQEGSPPDEVIVIDDGSTDQTPGVLRKYQGRILYRRIPNSGVAEARNVGLEMATGQLVAFCDHDDLWAKDKLLKQAQVLRDFSGVGLCSANFINFDSAPTRNGLDHFRQLNYRRRLPLNAPMGDALRHLLRENFIGTASTVLLCRDLAEKVGFFAPGYVPCDDYEYWLRCAMVTDFFLLPEILVYKRIHQSNLSHNRICLYSKSKEVIESIRRDYGGIIRKERLISICNLSRARHSDRLGDEYFEAGKKRKAFQLYWHGMAEAATAENLASFFWKISKKTLRLLTFDGVNKRKIRLWGKALWRRKT